MDPEAAARRSHFLSVYDAQKSSDALFEQLAADVAAAIPDVCGETMTIDCYPALMNRIDRALSRVYPDTKGAPSRLESAIATTTDRAARRSIKAALSPIMRQIKRRDPELYGVIENANGRGDR